MDVGRVAEHHVKAIETEHPPGVKPAGRMIGVKGLPVGNGAGHIGRETAAHEQLANGLLYFAVAFSAFFLGGRGAHHKELVAYLLQLFLKGLELRVFHHQLDAAAAGQVYQRVGRHKFGFQVGQRQNAEVVASGMRVLLYQQRYEEAQLGNLDGDGLDVHAIDAVFDQEELAGIVGLVHALLKGLLNGRQTLLALFVIANFEGLARFGQGYFLLSGFPQGVVGVEAAEHMHDFLQGAHGKGPRATGRVEQLNTAQRLYQAAPVVRVVERLVIVFGKELSDLVGRQAGGVGGVVCQGFLHHKIDHRPWGIKRARLLAGSLLGFGVVVGEQVFKHGAQQFGVKGHFLVVGGVFVNGKVVLFQQINQAGHFYLPVARPQIAAEIGPAAAEKEFIGHFQAGFVIAPVRKTVDAYLNPFFGAHDVEVVKQAPVQKRDAVHQCQKTLLVFDKTLVAVKTLHTILAIDELAAFFARGVEGGEKQVLQNGLVVGTAGFIGVIEQAVCFGFVKQGLGHQVFLFHKPHKNDPCDQPYHGIGVAGFAVFVRVVRKLHQLQRVEVPVAQLLVKLFGERLYAKGLLDMVERVKGAVAHALAEGLIGPGRIDKIGVSAPGGVFLVFAIAPTDKAEAKAAGRIVKHEDGPVFKIVLQHPACQLKLFFLGAAGGELTLITT